MKILVVGTMYSGSNARSFADAFAVDHEVRRVDLSPWVSAPRFSKAWYQQRQHRRLTPQADAQLRVALAVASQGWKADLLFCFKTVWADQRALLEVPAAVRVHYLPDDASNPSNVTPQYLEHEHGWDTIVTTKTHNVRELEERGARHVILVRSAYDPRIHHGSPARAGRLYTLGFIGAARRDRLDLPHRFANHASPGQAVVRGPKWRRRYPFGVKGVRIGGPVHGPDYASVASEIFASPILLNSENRDAHTCRSFEIPACGVLAIAPRTSEHQAILEEGSEALMFSSDAELDACLDRVASHPQELEAMAAAGHRRILRDRHSYEDRVSEILAELRAPCR
jgi:hypothetical protein